MSFDFRPAKREGAPILFGVAGGTGSGKTMSGLRVATGLAGGERFAVIDTENGRALHYADDFDFDHGALKAPFRPQAYVDAIKAADAKGYPVIMVDSASHEHAGDGGLLDWHEEILQKRYGDDWQARERGTFTAWVEPKQAHKALVNTLLQVKAHVVLCFRAEEKIDIVKVDGKTQVVPKSRPGSGLNGWIPVAEKNLPYEMTLSFLLTADKPGLPQPIKLQAQHAPFVPLDQPLSEDVGARLREWAAGEKKAGAAAQKPPASVETDDGNAAALAERLLELAAERDRRDEIAEAIDANRTAHADEPAKHVTWLKRNITRLENL